ncbi:MAG: amidohydrolase family protein [Vicinamibacterales bacterium]
MPAGRLFVAALLTLCIVFGVRPNAQRPLIVFEHVNLIPMDSERVMSDAFLLVGGGAIVSFGPGGAYKGTQPLPDGTVRVDGRGKFMIPALAEMHAHIPNDPTEAERVLFMYVANGIGTIRSMLGDASHFRLRERVRRGEIVGPTMILSGPSFSGGTAPTAAAASTRVNEQKKAGYDFLKIHPGIPLTAFNALAAAADKASIRFAGHVPAEVGLQRALQAKFSTIDHLDGYIEALAGPGAPASQNFGVNLMSRVDESRMAGLAQQTADAGVANVPTQILLENWYGPDSAETMQRRPEMQYVRAAETAQWVSTKRSNDAAVSAQDRAKFIAVRRRLVKALQDAGANLLLGSDAPQVWNVPGFSIHRELSTYVAAGLTPHQALATGTRNVAAHMGALAPECKNLSPDPLPVGAIDRLSSCSESWGTIGMTRRADLVLLDANPLENIANSSRIAGVMIGGRWIAKAEIDRRLAELRPR